MNNDTFVSGFLADVASQLVPNLSNFGRVLYLVSFGKYVTNPAVPPDTSIFPATPYVFYAPQQPETYSTIINTGIDVLASQGLGNFPHSFSPFFVIFLSK